jgi:hypothetical protein
MTENEDKLISVIAAQAFMLKVIMEELTMMGETLAVGPLVINRSQFCKGVMEELGLLRVDPTKNAGWLSKEEMLAILHPSKNPN